MSKQPLSKLCPKIPGRGACSDVRTLCHSDRRWEWIQRGKKGSERGSARRDPPQTLNEGEKDGRLLREVGQMAGTGNLLTLGDSELFF